MYKCVKFHQFQFIFLEGAAFTRNMDKQTIDGQDDSYIPNQKHFVSSGYNNSIEHLVHHFPVTAYAKDTLTSALTD